MTGDGLDVHHMPAKSVSGMKYAKSRGPAIQMDQLDHLETSSHSQRAGSRAWTTETARIIATQGQRAAMAREIWDVKRAAHAVSGNGRKYNDAIREMLKYAKDEYFGK